VIGRAAVALDTPVGTGCDGKPRWWVHPNRVMLLTRAHSIVDQDPQDRDAAAEVDRMAGHREIGVEPCYRSALNTSSHWETT
jgi:hypothetical protein